MPQHERDRIVVVSRDPRLADVRKRVLENAGFAVIAASDASIVEQACGHQRVRLIMLGHSLSPADKRHVCGRQSGTAGFPSWSYTGEASRSCWSKT
jgi:DNA-binding response OmpR family regulator